MTNVTYLKFFLTVNDHKSLVVLRLCSCRSICPTVIFFLHPQSPDLNFHFKLDNTHTMLNLVATVLRLLSGQSPNGDASDPIIDGVKRYAHYSTDELLELSLFERVKLNDWRLEIFAIGFITAFVVLFKLGDVYNTSLVNLFLKGLDGVFTSNFARFGVNAKDLYVKDSSEHFSSYASGRDNIAKVDVTIALKPRHNLFVWILEYVLSYFLESVVAPIDRVDFVITPSNDVSYDNFIFAIAAKLGMNDSRKFNYYLSLTKTTDSDILPPSFVFMGEVNEIQENVFTDSLKEALTVETANLIKYIAFTDQPAEKPITIADLAPRRRIVITTGITKNKKQLQQFALVLQSVFDIVDDLVLGKITFRPETLKKVLKTRENELGKINKILDDYKKEKVAEEKAVKKREDLKSLRNLSADEQVKLEKKANEKKQRKLAKKQKQRA